MSSPAPAVKFENILYEKKGPIAYVTLNRPKVLNALSQAVFSELKAAFEDARDDALSPLPVKITLRTCAACAGRY
jgi:enoyl-CoA hydratase/carnithine racemase